MDRRSVVVLLVIFGGLFASLFAFLALAWVAVSAPEEGGFGGPVVGVLEIKGVIASSDAQLKQLRRFRDDDDVKAIVVRIDSPGGAVAPAQEIFRELRSLRDAKKVVCSLADVAASGGYYIAAGCEKIVANPGTLTGSIGVISQLPYVGEMAEALKLEVVTLKSGEYKDVGNPFRPMSAPEKALFQGVLDSVHEQFIAAVAEGRGLKVEQVRPLADGRILTGAQAKEGGLVDELGNLNDAARLAAALAGLKGEPKLRYAPEERRFPFDHWLAEGGRAFVRGVRQELTASAAGGIAGPAYLAPQLLSR